MALDNVWQPTADQIEDADTLRDGDDPIEDYTVLGAPGEQPIWVKRTEAYYEAADYYYELAGDR